MSSDDSANAVASGKVETSADRKYPAWVRHDLERDYYDRSGAYLSPMKPGCLNGFVSKGFRPVFHGIRS